MDKPIRPPKTNTSRASEATAPAIVSSATTTGIGPIIPSSCTQPASVAPPIPSKRTRAPAPAMAVAKYLVYLASCEDEPDFLSHLRLQKLLYYVQGWSLALRNKPMFNDRIEAWAHGPVVRNVYAALADYGAKPILLDTIGMPEGLTEEEMTFIQSVWESYKRYSAISLREMTHKEEPWLDTRKGLGPLDRCEKEITQGVLRQ